MKKNILIVEDELTIIKLIKNRLNSDIYNIDIAIDGNIALEKISKKNYDLITLDIMLPFVDGISICKTIRAKSKQTLIIMLSAIHTEEFKMKAYDFGCDDYISKPFSAKELSLKIKSSLHRRAELNNTKIVSSFVLNEDAKCIKINEKELCLTPSEYLILSILILNAKRVYSRAELAQEIYNSYLGQIDDRGIDSHIYHIRKKIKTLEKKELIKTIRGMGYIINED